MNGNSNRDTDTSERKLVSLARLTESEWGPACATIVMFSIAVGILFFGIERAFDPDRGKDWWTLSFETRNADSSSFLVTNHSKATRFTYTVTRGGSTLSTGDLSVAKGDTRLVTPDVVPDSGRTSVSVSADDGTKREIYRER
ncbi:MAG TPA: hypothetical protein VN420_02370 [Candidatus Fimivivens sp.]|nr:hypothetical protein [Candidatus Fimivivens sp.]